MVTFAFAGSVVAFTEHNGRRRFRQWSFENDENSQVLLDPSCHNVILLSSNGSFRLLPLVTSPAAQPLQALQGDIVFSKHVKGSLLTDACCWETCTGVPIVVLGFEV